MAALPPAIEQVVHDCYDDVYRFVLSLTRSEADATDITQQAFLKLARKGDQIRETAKAKSWLFTVARNEFIDMMRKRQRMPTVELADESATSAGASAADRTDGHLAINALRRIPAHFREALALYYIQGYTYPEIASILDIPVGTVMSRLSRGKLKLKAALETPATA